MGMDVLGKRPKSEAGKYFGRTNHRWGPIADFVLSLAIDDTSDGKYWYSNDGSGLDAKEADILAERLTTLLKSDEAQEFMASYNSEIMRLPREECYCCDGSGIGREEHPDYENQREMRIPFDAKSADTMSPHPRAGEVGWCFGCDGRGWNPDGYATAPVLESEIIAFRDFVAASGGFHIH